VLYPFFQMATDPALSTQQVACVFANFQCPAATATSGPISSKADNFRPTFFPSTRQPPALIFFGQGM
jgi:hypothetical protein